MTQREILKREPNMSRRSGYGSYCFEVLKHGKKLTIDTHDSEFWDAWQDCEYKSRKYYSLARKIIKRFVNYGRV